MKVLFINLLNMSIVAGWLIMAVIIFRMIFKKAPRWIVGVLWCLVGFRLLCPFSVPAPFSIIPSTDTFVVESNNVTVDSGLNTMDNALNAYLMQAYDETAETAVSNSERIITSNTVTILLYVWIAGIAVLLITSIVSSVRMKRRLCDAVRYEDNVYRTEKINSPFVLGLARPKIYVPYYLNDEQLDCVILHERAHIKRMDHIIKPVAYALLAVYWFNPLVWIAFILLCRDIELACDEKVIRTMGPEGKKLYSTTLLECSVPHRMLLSCPIAFAEVSVKERILNIMKLKKANKWLVVGAVMAAMAVTLVFTTNPVNASEDTTIGKPIETADSADFTTAASTTTDTVAVTTETTTITVENAATEEITAAEETPAKMEESMTEETVAAAPAQEEDTTVVTVATNEDTTAADTTTANTTTEDTATDNTTTNNTTTDNTTTESTSSESTNLKLVAPVMGDSIIAMEYSSRHQAVDYAATMGTPLVAAISGTVTATGFDTANGNYIVITNSDGWSVYYNNCESVTVALNETVSAGSPIGTLGSTGNSTGPHLHFALTDASGNFQNPVQFY